MHSLDNYSLGNMISIIIDCKNKKLNIKDKKKRFSFNEGTFFKQIKNIKLCCKFFCNTSLNSLNSPNFKSIRLAMPIIFYKLY